MPGPPAQLERGRGLRKPLRIPLPPSPFPFPASIRCSPDQLEPGSPSWDLFQLPAPPRRPAGAGAALGCFLSLRAAAGRAPLSVPIITQDPSSHHQHPQLHGTPALITNTHHHSKDPIPSMVELEAQLQHPSPTITQLHPCCSGGALETSSPGVSPLTPGTSTSQT